MANTFHVSLQVADIPSAIEKYKKILGIADTRRTAVIERTIRPVFSYAAFATSDGCNALSFTGHANQNVSDTINGLNQVTATGGTIEAEIPVAAETPEADLDFYALMALLGAVLLVAGCASEPSGSDDPAAAAESREAAAAAGRGLARRPCAAGAERLAVAWPGNPPRPS